MYLKAGVINPWAGGGRRRRRFDDGRRAPPPRRFHFLNSFIKNYSGFEVSKLIPLKLFIKVSENHDCNYFISVRSGTCVLIVGCINRGGEAAFPRLFRPGPVPALSLTRLGSEGRHDHSSGHGTYVTNSRRNLLLLFLHLLFPSTRLIKGK